LGQVGRSPFFTEGGSFWLNRQEDWADLDGAGSCRRGECFRSGFNSLALIPLRSGERVVGLIQLVDRKPAAISLETIRFLEGIGVSVGIAFEHRQAEVRLQENENRLDFLTNYDPLTRLPNRTLLQDRLLHAMAKARRSGKKVAVLLVDLDRFKTINDSLGHDLGDRLLTHVADRLRALVREGDTLARFSGDEFVVVLEEVEELKSVMFVAQKMLGHLSEVITLQNYPLYLTGSIGITLFPNDAEDLDSLLKYAEVAMYRAKEGGRNAYQFYRPDMNARSRELLLLESSLRQALAQEQLTLFFQPKVELRSGRILGAEALVRWRHPELGMVSPAEFIPLTEETGLIVPIGEWILESACRHLVAWQEAGCPPLRMAVNISGRQFQQPDFVRMVEAILRRTGADADLLELEITESTAMENAEETIRTLTTLKAMGIHLAIDDFGTGHSSLSYLRRFPIDCLKIDRSFVREAAYNPNDAAIAAAIIALARGMSLSVVAEGIETREQMDFLLTQGCDIGQGFLFSRPVPSGEWEELRRLNFGNREGIGPT
jgi:diguanylate cyclase (GGDEF)-like protein